MSRAAMSRIVLLLAIVRCESAIYCQFEPKLRARCQPVGGVDNVLAAKLTIYDVLGKIKTLSMRGCLVRQVTSDAFADLNDVEHLDMSSNAISLLREDTFKYTPALVSLNASSNRIGAISPTVFAALVHLRQLDLSHNAIAVNAHEPFFLVSSSLRILDLTENLEVELDRVSNELMNLTSLRLAGTKTYLPDGSIQLSSTTALSMSRTGLIALKPDALDKLEQLVLLDLSHNMLSDLHPATFARNVKLKVLDLSHNNLKTLDDALFSKNLELSSLDASHNRIQIDSKSLFVSNAKLLRLDLNTNDMSKINMLLLQPLFALMYLDLRNNQLRSFHSMTFAKNRQLRSLRLDNNKIESFQSLAFSSNLELNELTLAGNGFASFPYSLVQNLRNLIVLDVSRNRLVTLEADITNLPELNDLHMSCNLVHSLQPEFFETTKEEAVHVHMHGNPFACACINHFLTSAASGKVKPVKERFMDGTWMTCLINEHDYCERTSGEAYDEWLKMINSKGSICS